MSMEESKTEKKYQKLINNLLAISERDQAIFTKINENNTFDFYATFGKKWAEEVLNKDQFLIPTREIKVEELVECQLHRTPKSMDLAQSTLRNSLHGYKLTGAQKTPRFPTQLTDDASKKLQKNLAQWLILNKQAVEANIQDNVWQLHLATFFVSLKTKTKSLYAPLILREVHFVNSGGNLLLKPMSAWKINEKLIYVLEEEGWHFDDNKFYFDNLNSNEYIAEVARILKLDVSSFSFAGHFENYKNTEITNYKKLEIHPGIVLGLFKPSGSYLRKTLIEIIQNGELEKILQPRVHKYSYEKNVNTFLQERSAELVHIQPSNFSQDKALMSAFIQDTIIWGPPGTGKSQVIANLIANILFHGKTAVIVSQKKAALDVLQKRLKKLAPFVLFVLNDQKANKEIFYKPLQDLIALVEYSAEEENQRHSQPLIKSEEVQALSLLSEMAKTNTYQASLALFRLWKRKPKILDKLSNLSKEFIYPFPQNKTSAKKYRQDFLDLNMIPLEKINLEETKMKILDQMLTISYNLANQQLGIDSQQFRQLQETNFQTLEHLKKVLRLLIHEVPEQVDEDFLEFFIAQRTLKKILIWEKEKSPLYKAYLDFANAVRAARRAPYKFINDHAKIIQEIFPVLITTPQAPFITWKKDFYDYVIIDESSQMFIETGLPLLYLGKIKVLAGDNQQMQPSNWFQSRENGEDENIEDGKSILTYGFDKGLYQVMLDQNYRSSSAALMAFSAKHFYESKLEVVDQKNIFFDHQQPIEVRNVGGKWNNGVNLVEAQQVIKIIKENQALYQSFIVITFNLAQKQLLEELIAKKQPKLYALLENDQLSIRNIENAQGDEADLVIISVIYDSTTSISSTYVGRPGGKNALNVAISRARQKMIVVKSVNATSLKPGWTADYLLFKNWLAFLDLTAEKKRQYSQNNCQEVIVDHFFQDVCENLTLLIAKMPKLSLMPNLAVGSQKVDFIYFDQNYEVKLVIKLDRFTFLAANPVQCMNNYLNYHSQLQFLRFKGYPLQIIKEAAWYQEKDYLLQRIKVLLEQEN